MVHALALWNIALLLEKYTIAMSWGLNHKTPFAQLCHVHSWNGWGRGLRNDSLSHTTVSLEDGHVSLIQNMIM